MTRRIALILMSAVAFAVAHPARAAEMRMQARQYELQVLIDSQPVRDLWHNGENWVLGELGARYTLRVLNHSGRPIEAVVSVDGRDVLDGQPGDPQKRGYLVPAWSSADIDGWRISNAQVAAFRFSSVAQSYAARTGSGREVGVIGVAIFEERPPPPVVYAPPMPRYRSQATLDEFSRGDAPASPAATTPPPESMPQDTEAAPSKQGKPGLGTEFGEVHESYVTSHPFERASTRPAAIIGCRYNDRAGLLALGIRPEELHGADERLTAEPFPTVDRSYAQPPPGWRP